MLWKTGHSETDTSASSAIPIREIELNWHGPYSWFEQGDKSIFAGGGAEMVGIYVWTVPVNGRYRVFYVGQTEKGFAERQHEHIRKYFEGAYHLYEPRGFREGRLNMIYEGFLYKKPGWKRAISFYQNFMDYLEPLLDHLRVLKLFVAPIDAPRRIHRRVESALMDVVYRLPGESGQFLERDLVLQLRKPDEAPIAVTQGPDGLLEGVPKTFVA
jgi:hypothetical protein